MPLMPVSEETIKSQQESLKDKMLGDVNGPAVVNQLTAEQLMQVSQFELPVGSGIFYDVPVVPVPQGLQLQRLYGEIKNAQKPGEEFLLAHYEMTLRKVLDVIWSLSVPTSFIKRFRKRFGLMRNPFLTASEGDIASLLSFFLVRRMMPSVKYHYQAHPQQ